MFPFTKKDTDMQTMNTTAALDGIVFQVKEVEALMAAAEDIALNLKSRIVGASQVIFKNIKQEH